LEHYLGDPLATRPNPSSAAKFALIDFIRAIGKVDPFDTP
jgi:hypothetical protein